MKKRFIEFLLIFLAIISILLYLWAHYIRERLPRDIPFDLTFFTFMFTLMICSVYIFQIKTIIKPSNFLHKLPHNLLVKITLKVNLVWKPFIALDTFIKKLLENKLGALKIVKISVRLLDYIYSSGLRYNFTLDNYILYIFKLPRFFLIGILSFDIFCLKNINIFYYFISLSLIPIIMRYIIHLLRYYKEHLIIHLESIYDDIIFYIPYKGDIDEYFMYYLEDSRVVQLREYIDIQTNAILYDMKCMRHTPFARAVELRDFEELPQLKDPEYMKIYSEFFTIMPYIIDINFFIYRYDDLLNYKDYKYFLVLVNSIYLLCWLYLLVLSLYNLNIESYIWLEHVKFDENPFI